MSDIKIHCAYDKLVPISEIKLNPENRNKHPESQILHMMKVIKYNGVRRNITVSNRSGVVTVGNGRFKCMQRLGMTHVPVDYQDYESDEAEYADGVADNALAMQAELDKSGINADLPDLGPDFDMDWLGIEDFVLEPLDKLEPGCDEDQVPEAGPAYVVRGDVFTLGRHRLLCGDSTNIEAVESLLGGSSVDMVFTDPPYGIDEKTDRAAASPTRKTKGNTFDKILGDDSIDTAVGAYSIADALTSIVVYWGGNYYAHKLPPSACWAVWDKRVEENQRDKNSDCELAYVKHPSKESVRIFRHLWKGMIKGSEHGQGRVHPTQKPVALAEWALNEFGPEGKTVLDLFGGSGSTLIACEKTNRQCFMMELDPKYCTAILNRWAKYAGGDPIRESDGKKWSEIKAEAMNG